jgi:N4-gp56 family major capsid protein
MKKLYSFILALFGLGLDVVTVSTGSVGTAGNVSADLITYMSAKLLEVAEFNCILDQFGEKQPLPSNSSKTIRFVRQEKLTVSTSQLTEGVTPDSVGITLNQFEATVEQYGQVIILTDIAELTASHNIVEQTVKMLGLQAAETYDLLIFNVLESGATNVYRPNSKAADTNLVAADIVGYKDLSQLAALMQDAGARPFGESFALVMCPQVHAALLQDADFKAAAHYAAPQRIWRGQAEELAGHRIVVSNSPSFAATAQAGAGQANKVYSSYCIGQMAFQITDLQNLRMYMAQPGGQSDVLQQRRKMGWKFAFKTLVTNTAWIRRVRSAGLNTVTNP